MDRTVRNHNKIHFPIYLSAILGMALTKNFNRIKKVGTRSGSDEVTGWILNTNASLSCYRLVF